MTSWRWPARDLEEAADALDVGRRAEALHLAAAARGRLQAIELDAALKTTHAGHLVPGAAADLRDVCGALVREVDGDR